MYTKVLAAVNEHFNSEVSARYAIAFSKTTHSKIYLCYIAEKGVSQKDSELAEDAVKRLFIRAKDIDIRVESVFGSGDPVTKIKELVNSEGISIVFAATRREDVERRFFAGTVARKLSLNLPCTVALVRVVHMGRIHPKNILVPLKERLNHINERAYFTAKIAESFGSKVIVFHATKAITKFFHGEIHLTPVEWGKRLPKDISEFMKYLKKFEVSYEERLAPGETAKSITIEAATKRHDLIIMGASERSLLSSLLKGNPVEGMLRETPCDLIILKPRRED